MSNLSKSLVRAQLKQLGASSYMADLFDKAIKMRLAANSRAQNSSADWIDKAEIEYIISAARGGKVNVSSGELSGYQIIFKYEKLAPPAKQILATEIKRVELRNGSKSTEWSGDSSKWPESRKIRSLDPKLRPKIQRVLAALKKRGFRPKVFFGWRSVAVQLELYKKGNTTVKFSFHNAQKKDGTPNSYAADIIDSRWAWTTAAEKNGFWEALGEEAKKEGLYWGGDWKSFKDWAHVQLHPNSMLGVVKKQSGL
ncbi:M15 family metallopeptidase [Roseiconus lacunae]|uniref:M15 family metallopeptidase n=1 Tax=Roseiconus lacunae TaxID=2605694 RepID=UPI001E453A1F|nr:M15 family metallopeptidase [Roseiconus lacunae]MCD0458640.1 M15 family metallopeptidase [Roseiconus lacunae]